MGTGNVKQRRFTPGEVALLQAIGSRLGVATFSADLSEARELICKADHALYDAKHAGRNRVREA